MNEPKHLGTFDCGLPIFGNDLVNCLVLSPKGLKSKWTWIVLTMLRNCAKNNRTVIRKGEATMGST